MDYLLNLLTLICLYTILTAALDLLIGYSGLMSFGAAAFVGIGGYAAALTATELGFGFLPALGAALLASGAAAILLAVPVLRLSGDYFVLATFGFSMVSSSIFENWVGLTNGVYGIYGIPRIELFGLHARSGPAFFAVAAVAMVLVLLCKQRLVTAPFGLVLKAIRDDETVAAMAGKNVLRAKVTVFVISSGLSAIAGALLAYQLHFIDPSLFALPLTIFLWAALFVGGCASPVGNLVGPAILVLFPEALRFIGLSGSNVANVQQALYGLLLITLALFRPQGLVGSYRLR